MATDYRTQDYNLRREFFKRYYHWQLTTQDCDPALYMLNYIHKRMELNIEQRYWIAWLYANTYNVATTWIIWNEFPDFENVDQERLEKWNAENYKKLIYETDNKWQKGHLPAMFASYKKNVHEFGCRTQEEYFRETICIGGSEEENFDIAMKIIKKDFFKFGRYLAFFYLQTLRETCDLPVMPPDLLLKDDSSTSHRNGLFYAVAMDQMTEKGTPFDKETQQYLDEEAKQILDEMRSEYPDVEVDYFTMETSLCSFKKMFRKKHGRYLGYYIDRQAENIRRCEVEHHWPGIEWSLLWDARKEVIIDELLGDKVVEKRMHYFLDNGQVELIDWFTDSKYEGVR